MASQSERALAGDVKVKTLAMGSSVGFSETKTFIMTLGFVEGVACKPASERELGIIRKWEKGAGGRGRRGGLRRMRPMGIVTGAEVDWPGAGSHSSWTGLTDSVPGSLLYEACTGGRRLMGGRGDAGTQFQWPSQKPAASAMAIATEEVEISVRRQVKMPISPDVCIGHLHQFNMHRFTVRGICETGKVYDLRL